MVRVMGATVGEADGYWKGESSAFGSRKRSGFAIGLRLARIVEPPFTLMWWE